MKELKTFEELFDVQVEKSMGADALDLCLVRLAIHIVDGYVIIVGADCKEDIEMFYIATETYEKFSEGEKDYIKHYYGEF